MSSRNKQLIEQLNDLRKDNMFAIDVAGDGCFG